MAKLRGYVRVSTDEQVTDLQRDAMVRAGVAPEDVYADEGVSGTKPALSRPGLSAAMAALEPGDTLIVWALSRLGRSTIDLLETVRGLKARGVHFRSLTESIDTSSPMGQMFFTIIAAFAELERNVLVERTRAGMAAAKARGQHLGRPGLAPELKRRLQGLVDAGDSVTNAAKVIGVSRAAAYRALRSHAIEDMSARC